jgi:hypothetical protein
MVSRSCGSAFSARVSSCHCTADISYHTIIRRPMDLSTVDAKLENGMYTSRQDFVEDINLIIKNCFTYNRPSDPVCLSAEVFDAQFKSSEFGV